MPRTPLLNKLSSRLFSGQTPSFYSLFLSAILVFLFAYITPGTNILSGLLVLIVFAPATYLIGYDLISSTASPMLCCILAIIFAEGRGIRSQLSIKQSGEWLYCDGFITVNGISAIVFSYTLIVVPLFAAVITSHIIFKLQDE